MDNLMEKGQIITTGSGARGLIHRTDSDRVHIKWFTNDSGEPIEEPLASYPVKDIKHSIKTGFLTLSAADDPNILFLIRKHNANS